MTTGRGQPTKGIRASLDRATAAVRLHWTRIAFAVGSFFLAWPVLKVADDRVAGSSEQALLHFLVGALLTTGGGSIRELATRWEAYREGSYTERAKAVQEILQHVRVVRERCLERVAGGKFAP